MSEREVCFDTGRPKGAFVIPMLARPLDQLVGPPDPNERMVPARPTGTQVWLSPRGDFRVESMHVNPGEPGQPELLPWKRRLS